ncbi:MAG: hypothetical protein H6818_09260 [Phycisphaerales bacterium]|nr:hypothetical protein [Phycisphaerales bacterium]MCB9864895.1 hypothetical protein [Phycisphaerales bacterium]
MSNEHEDSKDAVRHQNMLRIGEMCSPLPRADEERQARWQRATLNNEHINTPEGVPFMKRRKNIAFVTSGALAAAAALAVWFASAGASSVSAGDILANFRRALARKLTIGIDNVDLDSVRVNGEIVLDRNGEWLNESTDTLYAELHIDLKSDNPDWEDLGAALVVCQSPDNVWTYCRGAGGTGPGIFGPRRVTPMDSLDKGGDWQAFTKDPLGGFGSMALGMSFSTPGSRVKYRFPQSERNFVRQLLYFLLFDLGNNQTVDQIITQLNASAGNVVVEKDGDAAWVLRTTDIERIGLLKAPAPVTLPDPKEALKDAVVKFGYNQLCQCISTTYWDTPDALRKLGVGIKQFDIPDGPFDDVDSLVEQLQQKAQVVSVNQTSATEWDVEVKGLPATLDTSDLDWSRDTLPQLLKKLELRVYYDAAADRVRRAEIIGVGLGDGRITLDMDHAEIAPEQLTWDAWVKDCLITEEEMMSDPEKFFSNCTVVYEAREEN